MTASDQQSHGAFDDVGAGPAVVLLHAGIADRRMWREHLAWIADAGHRVVAVDLPGFGEHVPSPESLPPWEATVTVMDALGIEAAVVVGCSFGGAVALRLAVTAPERVRAVVLISAPAPGMEPSERLDAVWNAETEAMEGGDIDAAIDVVLAGWLAPDAPRELRDLVASMQRRAFELEAYGSPDEPPDPVEEHPERLREIAVPALVAAGESDMPDFLASARSLAQSLPRASHHVIAGAGHLAPLETPVAFRSLLEQFLAALDRG